MFKKKIEKQHKKQQQKTPLSWPKVTFNKTKVHYYISVVHDAVYVSTGSTYIHAKISP